MGRIVLFIGALFVLSFIFLFRHSTDGLSATIPKKSVAWHLYVADQGKFQVEFPGLPQVNSEQVPLEKGEHSLTYHIYTAHAGNTEYMVSVIEYPPGASVGDTDAVFEQMMNKMVAADPLQKLYKKEFGSFQGYRTLDFSIRGEGRGVEVRLIRVGQTLYLLSSSYPTQSETIHSEDFQHFLNSFKLL